MLIRKKEKQNAKTFLRNRLKKKFLANNKIKTKANIKKEKNMKIVILPNDQKSPEQGARDAVTAVNGAPIIVNLIKMAKSNGFFEAWICDNSDTNEIDNCISSNFEHFNGIEIRIFKFPREYKSGRILSALGERDLGGMFLVAPCDAITDLDIQGMISYHKEGARVGTVCITEQNAVTPIQDDTTCEIEETRVVNSGFYILEEESVEYTSDNEPIDTHLVPLLAEYDELSVYNARCKMIHYTSAL